MGNFCHGLDLPFLEWEMRELLTYTQMIPAAPLLVVEREWLQYRYIMHIYVYSEKGMYFYKGVGFQLAVKGKVYRVVTAPSSLERRESHFFNFMVVALMRLMEEDKSPFDCRQASICMHVLRLIIYNSSHTHLVSRNTHIF